MPLKFKVKNKEEIQAEFLPLYVQREDGWVLDVEGAVEKARVDEFRSNNVVLLKQLDELKARFNGIDLEETKALKESILTRHLIEAGRSTGVRKSAMDDFLARARGVLKLVNGVPTAFDVDGKSARYGKDGVTPLSLEEWTDALVQEAPHLFESNVGGGAPGSGSGGAVHSENPWKQESFNLTRQGQIMKKDPALARTLMAAARG